MSRIYKFRAWYEKRMSLPFTLSDDKARFSDDVVLHRSNFGKLGELMQFTGLHDRDGKEIWEGDIVRVQCEMTDKVGVGEIMYYQNIGYFGVEIPELEGHLNFGVDLKKECEVLGNIYENPELLK